MVFIVLPNGSFWRGFEMVDSNGSRASVSVEGLAPVETLREEVAAMLALVTHETDVLALKALHTWLAARVVSLAVTVAALRRKIDELEGRPVELVWVCDTYWNGTGRLLSRRQVDCGADAMAWLEDCEAGWSAKDGAEVSFAAHQVFVGWSREEPDPLGGHPCRASEL